MLVLKNVLYYLGSFNAYTCTMEYCSAIVKNELLLFVVTWMDLENIIFREVSQLLYAAAAAAKSLQSCPTLCDPMDCSLPGFSVHEILQARTLEWVAVSFSSACKWKVKVKSLSRV